MLCRWDPESWQLILHMVNRTIYFLHEFLFPGLKDGFEVSFLVAIHIFLTLFYVVGFETEWTRSYALFPLFLGRSHALTPAASVKGAIYTRIPWLSQ